MLGLFEELGLVVIGFFEYLGGIIFLLLETLSWIGKGSVRIGLTIQQMSLLGVSSVAIAMITTTFAGMVTSLQLAQYAVRYGVQNYAGGGVALAMSREFAPMLTAIVVAGRAGSAITAELGSMKVTEQIDALRVMGTSPARYLVVPRFLALIMTVPMLALMAGLGGTIGGAIVANLQANIQYQVFYDSIRTSIVPWDIYSGLIKAAIFAAEIALIACQTGLATSGGAAGVGKSTTSSVVNSMLLIFITNYFLSAWMYQNQ
jgi:phospholipid/cholesterol/gamma-HCH transport system permease protein